MHALSYSREMGRSCGTRIDRAFAAGSTIRATKYRGDDDAAHNSIAVRDGVAAGARVRRRAPKGAAPIHVATYVEVAAASAKDGAAAADAIPRREPQGERQHARRSRARDRPPEPLRRAGDLEGPGRVRRARQVRGTTAFRDKLKTIHGGPYDERIHNSLNVGPNDAAGAKGAIIVVSHVDVPPPRKDECIAALNPLADASRKGGGNQRFEVVQQTSRPNHFTVVEAWKDKKAYDAQPLGRRAAPVPRQARADARRALRRAAVSDAELSASSSPRTRHGSSASAGTPSSTPRAGGAELSAGCAWKQRSVSVVVAHVVLAQRHCVGRQLRWSSRVPRVRQERQSNGNGRHALLASAGVTALDRQHREKKERAGHAFPWLAACAGMVPAWRTSALARPVVAPVYGKVMTGLAWLNRRCATSVEAGLQAGAAPRACWPFQEVNLSSISTCRRISHFSASRARSSAAARAPRARGCGLPSVLSCSSARTSNVSMRFSVCEIVSATCAPDRARPAPCATARRRGRRSCA